MAGVDTSTLHRRAERELFPAFALAVDDVGLAKSAIERALIRAAQRSNATEFTPQQLWAEAFQWVTASRWPRTPPAPVGPAAIDRAGSVADAIADLPVRQRSAIVCDQVLGWNDDEIAAAHRAPVSTIDLRRRRALGELAKTLDLAEPLDLDALMPAVPALVEPATVRRSAQRRTLRTRAVAAVAGIGCITVAGLAIQAAPDDSQADLAVPNQVDPPRESQAPHAPIGDGRGGFVAYARAGGEISVSPDGATWTRRSRLNVGRIDLRLFAEQFFRSGEHYVLLIDSTTGGGASLSASDSPRIALSTDLVDWTILRLDLGPLPVADGLKPRIDLLSAAVVDDTVLVSVRVNQEVDHRSLGLRPADVCTTTDDRDGLVLHLCDGTSVPVAEQGPAVSGLDRLFVSRRGNAFAELATEDFFNPWGITAYDGQFGMLEASSNQLYVSDDGEQWTPLLEFGVDNRLGLIDAYADELLVVSPDRQGWRSHLIRDDTTSTGALPVGIDPTTIWIKPQIASGPAGWAIYLTTSRPWDRREDTVSGWAVHVDDWIIEQRPERSSIRLRSTSTDLVYEYHGLITSDGLVLDHPSVDRSQFGGVRLFHPGTGALLVDVDGRRIRDAWVSGGDTELDLSGTRLDPGQGRIEVDGFVVEGNIRTGPVTLRHPDGTSRSFGDGYSFTNADLSDGVEATVAADPIGGALTFYDHRGAEVLSVDAPTVLAALDPVPDEDSARARAMVLFSDDGVSWEQLWSTPRPTWYGSIAVGDDEVLLSTAAFATGPERIPIDQSDS